MDHSTTEIRPACADIDRRLGLLSDALSRRSPESWVHEAAGLREVFERAAAGKLPDRCRELEKLGAPEEIFAAQLIYDGILEEVALLRTARH